MKKITINSIFNNLKKANKSIYEWDFSNLDNFILSFEKKTLIDNINISKKYGNITKTITKNILDEDLGFLDFEKGEKFSDKKILDYVKNKPELYKKFQNIYSEIFKRNYWKLKTPFISKNWDLELDKKRNDIERFKIVYNLYIKENPMIVKSFKKNKKIEITIVDFKTTFLKRELETLYYILYNKVKRKKNGRDFLKNNNITLINKIKR